MIPKNSSTRRHIIQPLASDSHRIANDVGVQLLTFYTCSLGADCSRIIYFNNGIYVKRANFFPSFFIIVVFKNNGQLFKRGWDTWLIKLQIFI